MGPLELFDCTYDPSGVGAVRGCLLQTLNPYGVRDHDGGSVCAQQVLGCAPKVRQRVKVGVTITANAFLQFAKALSQSRQRLVKRTRALLESTPPGITNRRLIKSMSEGVATRPRPFKQQLICKAQFPALIDLPMPQKTHDCASVTFGFDRLRSNSAGGT